MTDLRKKVAIRALALIPERTARTNARRRSSRFNGSRENRVKFVLNWLWDRTCFSFGDRRASRRSVRLGNGSAEIAVCGLGSAEPGLSYVVRGVARPHTEAMRARGREFLPELSRPRETQGTKNNKSAAPRSFVPHRPSPPILRLSRVARRVQ